MAGRSTYRWLAGRSFANQPLSLRMSSGLPVLPKSRHLESCRATVRVILRLRRRLWRCVCPALIRPPPLGWAGGARLRFIVTAGQRREFVRRLGGRGCAARPDDGPALAVLRSFGNDGSSIEGCVRASLRPRPRPRRISAPSPDAFTRLSPPRTPKVQAADFQSMSEVPLHAGSGVLSSPRNLLDDRRWGCQPRPPRPCVLGNPDRGRSLRARRSVPLRAVVCNPALR